MSVGTGLMGSRAASLASRIGWSGALWLAVSVVLLFLPLVNILGYESALALNLLVVLIGGVRVIGTNERAPVWTKFWRRVASIFVWVCISGVLVALNGVRVRNCDVGSGLGFWLMFGVGSIPPVVALTLLVERFTRGRRSSVALYLGIVIASMISSGMWLALQPPLVVYDAFAGFWAVSIYDEAIGPWDAHLAYRAMTWTGAALWCQALAFETSPSRARAGWIAALALTTVLFFANAATLNISRDRSYAEALLGGRIETPHFIIHYEASGFSDRRLQELIADHELQYDELRAFWGVRPSQKLRSYIYASPDTRAEAMGVRSTMIARVWLGEMHLVWRGFGDGLLKHEMSHLMLREHGRGPLRLSSANGLLPLMGLVEGSAGAAAWEVDELNDHGWSAAILATGQMEDLAAMTDASGFWAQPSRLSYTLWSSFSRWLIDTRGPERFLNAYRDGNFARAYGVSMHVLLDEWKQMLANIELSAAEKSAAQMRFERPSILRRMCGRAIAQHEADAHQFIVRREFSKAEEAVEWLDQYRAQDPYLQFRIARLWTRLDETARAQDMYTSLLRQAGIGPELAQRTRMELVDLAWMRDDFSSAQDYLQALKRHPMTTSMARAVWVREKLIDARKTSPHSSQAARRYLTQMWRYRPLELRMDLLASALHEGSAPAAWLAYRFSARTAESVASDILEDLLLEASLPVDVGQRFTLDRLRRSVLRGTNSGCEVGLGLEKSSSNAGNAVSDKALMLRKRCKVSGRYLDAARRAME